MVLTDIEIAENVRFLNSCIKFSKIFIESFDETSLIWRLADNSNHKWSRNFQLKNFKENFFHVIRE